MTTLKDISNITGYSVTTVSRALKDGEDVKENTRDYIKSVAKKMGYSVNLQGLSLRTGINYNICMIMPLLRDDGLDRDVGNIALISGITAALENTPYKLNIIPLSAGCSPLDAIKEVVEGNLAGGIIFNLTTVNDERIEYLTKINFPFVAYGRSFTDLSYSFVDIDEEDLGYKAVDYLIKKGANNILCINGDEIFTYAHYRKQGMLKACIDNGFDAKHHLTIIKDLSDAKIWREYFCSLMKQDSRPDGIYCGTEITALGCYSGIIDAGLKINRDVHVICTEFSDLPTFFSPPLSGIRLNNYQTGLKLGNAVLKQVESKNEQKTQLILKPEIMLR
ncbi:MAG: LacI family DNA-binding transcriptional regulator [Succinivibrio sp.]|nr:LacI family DNA-binding transcriptional regulator [Succinivibrio sp.]